MMKCDLAELVAKRDLKVGSGGEVVILSLFLQKVAVNLVL